MNISHWKDNPNEIVIRYPQEAKNEEDRVEEYGTIFTYWADGRFEPFLPHFDDAAYVFYKFR